MFVRFLPWHTPNLDEGRPEINGPIGPISVDSVRRVFSFQKGVPLPATWGQSGNFAGAPIWPARFVRWEANLSPGLDLSRSSSLSASPASASVAQWTALRYRRRAFVHCDEKRQLSPQKWQATGKPKFHASKVWRRKFLITNWLPRMDSNHDKVIQSHLASCREVSVNCPVMSTFQTA